MAYFLSPIGNSQFFDSSGNPLNGGKIYTYLAGSSTASATYTDNTGATPQANPIVLNSLGLASSPIWLAGGVAYKFVVKDAADVTLETVDNISGINDNTAATLTEWVLSGLTPTYINATSFSVAGDQTAILTVGRRTKTTNTAGLIYSRISVSSYETGITTITVVNDSGVLDAGLSVVAYGFLSSVESSLPNSTAAHAAFGIKQIQPLLATVATNALTLTLNPTNLDFRSATLGSGTVNNRAIAAAISMVVPSTATLGTVNAIQNRLVLLAIDNAGTIELAVVNITGGNNLDETTLINTTAIDTASDASNVIYSTTTRTSVPFRVVGYVESTQATAGTWATAPSTIQGIGGQALAVMSSIGYSQKWVDVTTTRAASTTYYNTTGKPITVEVTANNGGAGQSSFSVNGIAIAAATIGSMSHIVPPGNSYSALPFGGLFSWFELR